MMLVKGSKLNTTGIKTILLIQLGDIGDVVLSMPAIRALSENFPQAQVVVAVREKAKELIEDCPWASGVISINKAKRRWTQEIIYQKNFFLTLRKFHFDLTIDLRTGDRGAILTFFSGARHRIGRFADDGLLWRNRIFTHLVSPLNELDQYAAEHSLNILSPLDLNIRERRPVLSIPEQRKRLARSILKQEKVPLDRPLVAVHPYSLWEYKEWKISELVTLINHITAEYNCVVIITGSKTERKRAKTLIRQCKANVFNLAGKTSIGALAGVFQACGLFIGVDTGALHMAAAVGIPTIGIFGPSSQICWAPRGDRHHAVSKNMPCVPCRDKGCQDSETSRCLDALTFEEIKETVDQQLKGIKTHFL